MAAVTAIVPLFTTLSLNTHPRAAQRVRTDQPAPYHSATPAVTKTCARVKLRLFKQAAKAKFRGAANRKMTSRPVADEVIEISDNDSEDELPCPQRRRVSRSASRRTETGSAAGTDNSKLPYRRPRPAYTPPCRAPYSPVEDGHEAESDDTSSDSGSSGCHSPYRTNRQMVCHLRSRTVRKTGNPSASSLTSTEDSDDVLQHPRRKYSSQTTTPTASLNSISEDLADVFALATARRAGSGRTATGRAPRIMHNGNKGASDPDPCPYYYDQKLDVKMYRGPGYEKFPVVLGTVRGHKEICDKWDAQYATKNTCHDMHSTETGVPLEPKRTCAELQLEDACLQAVLQVFPEIEHEFVRDLYRKSYARAVAKEDIIETVSGALIAEIAESETYPKQKLLKRKASLAATDETGTTIAWNKDLPKNQKYYTEAIILLADVFDHIPTHYISKIVREKQSLFGAFGFLTEKENNFYKPEAGERPYKRLRQSRRNLEGKYQRNGDEPRDGHQYVNLVNELQAARQTQAREAFRIKRQRASDELESENLALHMAQGSMVECQCCFEDKPINRAVPCEGDEAHFFCNECVKRLAESQIGAMKYEMLCMDTSGCKAVLSTDGVAQAIPLQLFDKLAFNQQQAEISSAGIQGLEMCPFCDFKAICEPVEVDSLFACQNPDCGVVTCRKCKQRSHLPQTCDEVRNDKGLGARHMVEEARSEAMMRTCPKCKVKLIKELGCNKMVCTNCCAVMCYVCQKDISGTGKDQGYGHFHQAGATCPLYDQTGVDRHIAEANAAEVAAIEQAKAEDEDVDEKALRIETRPDKEIFKMATAPALPPAPYRQAIPYPPTAPKGQMPGLPAMPRFPVAPQRKPVRPVGHIPQVVPPNFQHRLPPGHGQLPRQMHQDLNPMQLPGQQRYGPANEQANPALPVDYGIQQRQALQAFLRQRRQNQV